MSRNRSNALRQSGQNFREGKLGNVVHNTNPQGHYSKAGISDRSKRIKDAIATTVPINLPPVPSSSYSPSSPNFFIDDLDDNIKLNVPTAPPPSQPPSQLPSPSSSASSTTKSPNLSTAPPPSQPPAPLPAPSPAPSPASYTDASSTTKSPAPSPASYTDASSTTKSPAPLFNDNDYTPFEIEKIITGLKGRDIAVNFGNIRKYRDLNFNNTENQCAWLCKKQILKKTRGTVTNTTERCNFKNLKLQFVRSKYIKLKPNIFESTIPKFTLCHNHIRKFLGVKIKKDVLTSTKERNIDDFICFYNVFPKKDGKEVGNLIKKNSNANCIISNNTILASKKIEIGAEFFL